MLIFRGVVDDRGSVPALPVSLNIVATLSNDTVSDVVSGDVETGAGGGFDLRLRIDQDRLDPFGGSATVVVAITPYVAGAGPVTLVFEVLAAPGQTLREAINQRIDELEVSVDLDGLTVVPVVVSVFDDVPTRRFFDDVGSLQCELWRNAFPPNASFFLPTIFGRVRQAPAYDEGDLYRANLLVENGDLDFTHFLRFVSDGPNADGHVTVRLREMAPGGLSNADSGAVIRIDERVGIGTISSALSDREAAVPIVLMDLDLDFVVDASGTGQLRVRGDVGIGPGANLVLFTVGSIDALVSITPRNHESGPFDEPELENLFAVTVTDAQYESTPGTDLDDLPFWVYLALAPFLPGFAGLAMSAALARQAIEAAVESILPGLVENQIRPRLAAEVLRAVNRQIDQAVDDSGLPLTDEGRANLLTTLGFWFEAQDVVIDENDIRVLGWAGGWGTLASLALGGECPALAGADASGGGDDEAARDGAEKTFRPFADAFERPELDGWMEEYRRFRGELVEMARSRPGLYARAARIAARHRELLAEPRERTLSQAGAEEIAGFVEEAMAAAPSEELRAVMGEIRDLFRKAPGRTVAQLAELAARARPAGGRGHELSPSRLGKASAGERRTIVRVADDGKSDVGRVVGADPEAREPSSEEARRKRQERRGQRGQRG